MADRQTHQQEVHAFLKQHLSIYDWKFSLPQGSGRETYFARGFKRVYFVKVGVQVERYLTMADLGLTPPIILHGQLQGGASIIVQSFITGRKPSRSDYHSRLADVAALIRIMHNNPRIMDVLQAASPNAYKDAGLLALGRLRQKWELYKAQVPAVADFVDNSLDHLAQQVNTFSGGGLVASHGDICDANWLLATDGRMYMLDFESMRMDDPALDLGALLWWYYPADLRQRFLDSAGYRYDDEFRFRMQIRMAMHCLDITLPRENSFDKFDPEHFREALRDFKAAIDFKENPEGYS